MDIPVWRDTDLFMAAYFYVGPKELLALANDSPTRRLIQTPADVARWIQQTGQRPDAAREVTATFIIATDGNLWIADRHSEHVGCAAGGPVLSAGEMTFRLTPAAVEVTHVTNQSTGFCPEPESWRFVQAALEKCGLPHPGAFTTSFHFRRCRNCGSLNLVKEEWFFCGVCDAALNRAWNLQEP